MNGVKIEIAFGEVGKRIEPGGEGTVFLRLDQPEMAFRYDDCVVASDRTEYLNSVLFETIANQPGMARTRHLVEDHPGNRHILAVVRKAVRDGCGGLRLTGHVKHQDHRPAGRSCDVGGRTIAPGARTGDAIEQAHDAFGKTEVSAVGSIEQRPDPVASQHPGVEVER